MRHRVYSSLNANIPKFTWKRPFCWKLLVSQLVKKFTLRHGSRSFIEVFTKAGSSLCPHPKRSTHTLKPNVFAHSVLPNACSTSPSLRRLKYCTCSLPHASMFVLTSHPSHAPQFHHHSCDWRRKKVWNWCWRNFLHWPKYNSQTISAYHCFLCQRLSFIPVKLKDTIIWILIPGIYVQLTGGRILGKMVGGIPRI
jgi:hypothetical protein